MESTWEYDNKEGSSGKLIEHRTNRKNIYLIYIYVYVAEHFQYNI